MGGLDEERKFRSVCLPFVSADHLIESILRQKVCIWKVCVWTVTRSKKQGEKRMAPSKWREMEGRAASPEPKAL
jgi:hypothetical protein